MTFTDYKPSAGDYPPGNPNMPFGYLGGLIGWIGSSSAWKVISYRDLKINFNQDDDGYLAEFQHWHASHVSDRVKYCLFQYDVDARPDVTHALMKVHMAAGVPATVMVFRERIWDRIFKAENRIEFDETYQLDFGLLREFTQEVGSIGYHCNVWERSWFDEERARNLFATDLEYLRSQVPIEFFSMHGGPTDPQGRSNAQLDLSDLARQLAVTWVHNGRSPSFHRNWDDGGAANPSFRLRVGDVGDALRVTKPGQRLRCLIHPQYYRCVDPGDVVNKNQEGMRWFDDMLGKFDKRERSPSVNGDGAKGERANKRGLRRKRKIWKSSKTRNAEPDQTDATGTTSAIACGDSDTDWFATSFWPANVGSYEPSEEVADAVARCWRNESPVFINGMSRSGTTLLCGLFDVRSDTAMSYELYPNYIVGPGERMEKFIDYLEIAYITRNASENDAYKLLKEKGLDDAIRLLACANHSDLTARDVGEVIFEFMRTPSPVYTYQEALRLISALAQLKCVRTNKHNWGMKIQGKFEEYFSLWPKARYVYIMRDGRDILASQQNTGSFAPEPAKLGKAWSYRIKRYEDFLEQTKARGAVVQYEHLVVDPENTLRKLCSDLSMEFDSNMLSHSNFDISLLHNPRGQLSADRVAVPIDAKAVGRWKSDLSKSAEEAFVAEAGDAMARWGYQ